MILYFFFCERKKMFGNGKFQSASLDTLLQSVYVSPSQYNNFGAVWSGGHSARLVMVRLQVWAR